ncbi:hypothetical protein JAAARDRAFT_125289 [Jaapia argillacea MUCL 33604]|uniref:Gaa1-domain-containing protein n=1 Tax=Jaapia argillacea MUCL 33604 TaxID=933084 RepID=A0A067QBY0_9AGAM|nr:hypothetical protein JAAARDRAFT_125289 [Jaapia argillacea MUCL 33604]
MLLVPLPFLSQGTYIDENALQPGAVNTYWSWGDVHRADRYLEGLEALRDNNASSNERADFISKEFKRLGLDASTQRYHYAAATGAIDGVNAYAVLSSPRSSGSEAMVISASWLSRTGEGDGTLNLRGVSTVLSLAAFLKKYSLWAKDIVFVIGDGYLDGMHAWLSAYHGAPSSVLEADSLELPSGVIWTALNIDYPGHSFSHLGIFFEGVNGRLPNQDLLNSFQHISRYTGGVPVLVYDHLDPRDYPGREVEMSNIPSWLPDFVKNMEDVQEYSYAAKNVLRHVGYQARGMPSGVHGLFHQFRIDAITIFAVPAPGPHGFHAIGRVVESTLRTMNNLLERLHASFFFYLLKGPTTFMKIGTYLPSAVLISVALLFGGLGEWVNAGWVARPAFPSDEKSKDILAGPTQLPLKSRWTRRSRPVLPVLSIICFTHATGLLLFFLLTKSWVLDHLPVMSPILFLLVSLLAPAAFFSLPSQTLPPSQPFSTILKSFTLCLASTVISIISVLNFSLAATLAVLLGVPLSMVAPSPRVFGRIGNYIGYITLGFGWLFFIPQVQKAVWAWEVLGIWFAPFVCLVYAPLVMQAAIVCLFTS